MNKSDHQVAKVHPQSYWSVEFDKDVVCVPSLTFDRKEIEKVTGHVHYEERQLFNLILLKNPNVRLFYVTSVPLGISIVQYYLSLLDLSLNEVKDRLFFLSTHDSSPISLTQKMLDRPKLIERIKKAIRPGKAIMLAFNSTPLECTLADQLGISAFGNCAGSDHWGSKSGSREVFQEAEIPCAKGINLTRSLNELADNIAELCVQDVSIRKMMVKLDQGFSGNGNAFLVLDRSVEPSREWAIKALEKMQFSCPKETWEGFKDKIEVLGVIAEVFFEGESPKSPSVQGSIAADGHVEILSTHEQILNGQVYMGCNFPASEGYRAKLHEYGRRVGKVLASKGVRGHYGVDFLVQATDKNDPSKTSDDIFAIEINLRQCGTTHPFFTMKLLTGGTYDKKTGLFLGANDKHKYYAASDNLHKPNYIGLVPEDIIDMSRDHEALRFDKKTERGPVFHLLGALSQHGKIGLTCIGDSPEDAMKIMKRVEEVLDLATPPTTPSATPSVSQQQSETKKTTEKLKESAIRMIPLAQAQAVAM